MKYLFKCDDCNISLERDIPLGHITENDKKCPECGKIMHQDYKKASGVIIPDEMKAGEDEDLMDWVKDKMNNRPSGKDKVFY